MCASRPVRPCCSIAAPTSSSRRRAPTATTSQSDLVLGQSPLPAFPMRTDRLLYSVHFGTVPGVAGNPTNFGLDPYIASRARRAGRRATWASTRTAPRPTRPSRSPLSTAERPLDTFAFGGNSLCSPCFGDGTTGVPVRLGDGSLAQGMQGSLDPGACATPIGYVGKALSDDGSTLVFGSTCNSSRTATRTATSPSTTATSLTGVTHVVSKAPKGKPAVPRGRLPRPGSDGIGELDISSDGSRILRRPARSRPTLRAITTGTCTCTSATPAHRRPRPRHGRGVALRRHDRGRLAVFFTTTDQLAEDDTDTSADSSKPPWAPTTRRPCTWSRPGPAVPATPTPATRSHQASAHWNNARRPRTTARPRLRRRSRDRFGQRNRLLPLARDARRLGLPDQPNLFVARPGRRRSYITTLEPETSPSRNARDAIGGHSYGDFQVTPDGAVAVFTTRLPLTGYAITAIRRSTAMTPLATASTAPRARRPTRSRRRTPALRSSGLSLTDDGRVFFTSGDPLALRDTNGHRDVYEWNEGGRSADLDRHREPRLRSVLGLA